MMNCFGCGKYLDTPYGNCYCNACQRKWQKKVIKEEMAEDAAEVHMAENKRLYYGEE